MKKRMIDFIRKAISCKDMSPADTQEGFDIAMELQKTGRDDIGYDYVSMNGFKICITDYIETYFLLDEGKKILAIKKLRTVIPNLGLREAKDMTEVPSLFPARIYRQE